MGCAVLGRLTREGNKKEGAREVEKGRKNYNAAM